MSGVGKLFVTTFLVIFLAELGDKTQLAVMARAASVSARWTVFLAASLALVTSTLVAVLLGRQLTRFVPESHLRVGAAVVFIVFGLLMLVEALRAPRPATAAGAMREGPLTRLVLTWAADFEKATFDDYRKLADHASDPGLRALFQSLAREEDGHLRRIRNLQQAHEHAHLESPAERPEGIPERESLFLKLPKGRHDDTAMAREIAAHERVTAGFYRELARMTLMPGLRSAFDGLAGAETEHAARIEQWMRQREPDERLG